jgi:hypothetical protein
VFWILFLYVGLERERERGDECEERNGEGKVREGWERKGSLREKGRGRASD